MLTRFEKMAFQILKKGFSFMPTHPVHFHRDFTRLKITSDKMIWLYFLVAIMLSLLICGAILLDVTYHLFIHPLPKYNPGTLVLHLTGVFGSGGFLVAITVMTFNSEAIKGFNEIIAFENQLPPRVRPTPTEPSIGFLDLAIMTICAFCVITPVVIMSSSLFLSFDPFYFIFEELFAKYPNLANLLSWKVCFAIRIITVSPVFECVRTISYLLICGLLVLIRFGKQIRLLEALNLTLYLPYSFDVIRVHYQIQVNFTFLNEAVHSLLSIVLSAGYWFFVLGGWTAVKGFNLMPEYIYVMVLVGGTLFSFLNSVLITNISKDVDTYFEVSRKIQEQARELTQSVLLTREQKKDLIYLCKLSNTVRPVKMVYKPFLIIDHAFHIDYWSTAIDRLLDVVLMT